jgi:hypothetical protein
MRSSATILLKIMPYAYPEGKGKDQQDRFQTAIDSLRTWKYQPGYLNHLPEAAGVKRTVRES